MNYDILVDNPRARHWGGGGPSSPPPNPVSPQDDPGAAKERSDAEARARLVAKKRSGARAARLTDPVLDALNAEPGLEPGSDQRRRVSMLGGGETKSGH